MQLLLAQRDDLLTSPQDPTHRNISSKVYLNEAIENSREIRLYTIQMSELNIRHLKNEFRLFVVASFTHSCS